MGGTPELRIVVGVDDNLTPSLLPLVWWRTEGGKGPDSPGSSLAFRKGGIPAAREPPLCHPRCISLQATHSCALEALRPRVLLRPRGAGRLRAAAVPGFGRNQGMQRFPPPAPSLEGGERPVRGVGGGVSLVGCGRSLRGCREGRGAAGQAGKSHTRSGSGDAPAAPLLLLYLAADSGPRICIFWHPVEK